MSLFKNVKEELPGRSEPDSPIPVTVLDLSKRYDLYCTTPTEERLYNNVKILGIRTFEKKKQELGMSLIGGYLEIEADNGTRMMIPSLGIYMICEHGSKPVYKVLRVRNGNQEA